MKKEGTVWKKSLTLYSRKNNQEVFSVGYSTRTQEESDPTPSSRSDFLEICCILVKGSLRRRVEKERDFKTVMYFLGL